MARFLLAWELGGNLGHIVQLRGMARALVDAGHEVVFALRDVVGGASSGCGELGLVLQAPLLLKRTESPAWTMADVLLSSGYASARVLQGLTGAWASLIELSRCDALVADHSPTALLAARIAARPALNAGHGFFIPPDCSPLPVFRDWMPVNEGHAARSDALALGVANQVLQAHAAAPLQRLGQLFHPQKTLLCTWPELDPYADAGRPAGAYAGPQCEAPAGVRPQWPAGDGPRVFAYLRRAHPDHAELLRALDALNCRTVCYMPDRPPGGDPVASARIAYATGMVDMRLALADSAMFIGHGGHASVVQALLQGVPSLLMPMQAEQFLMARSAARTGAALNAFSLSGGSADYRELIAAVLAPHGSPAKAARAMADKYSRFDPADPQRAIVAAAESLVRA